MKLKKILRIALSQKLYFSNTFYYLSSFTRNLKIITSNSFDYSKTSYKFPLVVYTFENVNSLLKSIKNFYEIVYCNIYFYFVNFLNNYLYLFYFKNSLSILRYFLKITQFLY